MGFKSRKKVDVQKNIAHIQNSIHRMLQLQTSHFERSIRMLYVYVRDQRVTRFQHRSLMGHVHGILPFFFFFFCTAPTYICDWCLNRIIWSQHSFVAVRSRVCHADSGRIGQNYIKLWHDTCVALIVLSNAVDDGVIVLVWYCINPCAVRCYADVMLCCSVIEL